MRAIAAKIGVTSSWNYNFCEIFGKIIPVFFIGIHFQHTVFRTVERQDFQTCFFQICGGIGGKEYETFEFFFMAADIRSCHRAAQRMACHIPVFNVRVFFRDTFCSIDIQYSQVPGHAKEHTEDPFFGAGLH